MSSSGQIQPVGNINGQPLFSNESQYEAASQNAVDAINNARGEYFSRQNIKRSYNQQLNNKIMNVPYSTVQRNRNVAQSGGGSVGTTIAGTTATIGGEMYYSKQYGTWMGKNFKMYKQTWGGNGATGGKFKFGKKNSTGFKIGGYDLGVWNTYSINSQHKS